MCRRRHRRQSRWRTQPQIVSRLRGGTRFGGPPMSTVCFALVLLVVWTYLIAATVATLRFSRRPLVAASQQAGISVLKPLHGAEPGLYENLRSFADQDYPDFQLLLGVRDGTDTALPIARALIQHRPARNIEIV